MGIMEDLNSIDEKVYENLSAVRERRRIADEEELRREKEQKEQKEIKKEKIKEIIEDDEESLDEPHVYNVTYSHSGYGGGGYGYGPRWEVKAGTKNYKIIMTEREKRIAELTGWIRAYIWWKLTGNTNHNNPINSIESIAISDEELSQDENLIIDSIKEKVLLIKTNEEAENDCVLGLHDDDFYSISIDTSLRKALLSTISLKSGIIQNKNKNLKYEQKEEHAKKEEKEHTSIGENGSQKSEHTMEQVETKVESATTPTEEKVEQENTSISINKKDEQETLSAKVESKISFKSIKQAIKRALGIDER